MTKNVRNALIAVALAVIVWCLFGCGGLDLPPMPSVAPTSGVTVGYLRMRYEVYNDTYFQNKLPKNPTINFLEEKDMASTFCNPDGTDCIVKFNLRYVAAERVADEVMLHEQCHIKTWMKDLDFMGAQADHGRLWRSCMLELDMAGAFRRIIIDNYAETN